MRVRSGEAIFLDDRPTRREAELLKAFWCMRRRIYKKAGVIVMHSKLQSIARIMAVLFFVTGGMSIAYGQQIVPPVADQKFANRVLKDDMLEVALAKEAASKSTDKDVQNFANRLIQDDSKGYRQLEQLVQKDGLQVPDKMGGNKQRKLQKFSSLHGRDFDRAYIRYEVKDHRKDMEEFAKEAKDGINPDLKNLASQTMPELRQHLSMAEDINLKMVANQSAQYPWWEFWKKI